jgi:hypothetical protein
VQRIFFVPSSDLVVTTNGRQGIAELNMLGAVIAAVRE